MTDYDSHIKEIQSLWNTRATLGSAAGTGDLNLKQLEMQTIMEYVSSGMRILDAGCGNGITAIEIAKQHNVELTAFDFAEGMIEAAKGRAEQTKLRGTVNFLVEDIGEIPSWLGKFDLIYTERALINLPDWQSQQQVIEDLTDFLDGGGAYVMCENSQDALENINALRESVGLYKIESPWHNRYFGDDEIEMVDIPNLRLDEVRDFTSTYYFLSRVVNAWLAAQDGNEPRYDAPINKLALQLPPIGKFSQTRIWLWRALA